VRTYDLKPHTQAAGAWPPSVVVKREGLEEYHLVEQENKILMPSSFSPLQ